MPDNMGPIRRMLERYSEEGALRFHMPGHKGLAELPGACLDVTEVPGTDALFDPQEGILEAALDAAQAWGAGGSFLLVNGSTAGLQAMALWAKAQGRRLVLPRNSHLSAVYACALADMQPIWAEPEWDRETQLFRWNAGHFLRHIPDEKSAVLLTYPDYYGRCIDIGAFIKQLDGRDSVLLADAAHGAHFAFSAKLPPDAGTASAIWVTGAHKTLPAPTQTAFLHVKDAAVAPDMARLLRGVTTSSPSYILMAGLDEARAYMQAHRAETDEWLDNCMKFSSQINSLDGLRCWDDGDAARLGFARHDPTRIVVETSALGISGIEAGARLRALGLQVEMCDLRRVVLVTSVMDGGERFDAAYEIFRKLSQQGGGRHFEGGGLTPPRRGCAVMTLREAWLSVSEEAELRLAVGRVAAEPFGAYPPGIPLCVPGECIPADAAEWLEETEAAGAGFFGVRRGRVSVVKI